MYSFSYSSCSFVQYKQSVCQSIEYLKGTMGTTFELAGPLRHTERERSQWEEYWLNGFFGLPNQRDASMHIQSIHSRIFDGNLDVLAAMCLEAIHLRFKDTFGLWINFDSVCRWLTSPRSAYWILFMTFGVGRFPIFYVAVAAELSRAFVRANIHECIFKSLFSQTEGPSIDTQPPQRTSVISQAHFGWYFLCEPTRRPHLLQRKK